LNRNRASLLVVALAYSGQITRITGQSLPALAFDLEWLSADCRGLFCRTALARNQK
jgi:hypothetical protein